MNSFINFSIILRKAVIYASISTQKKDLVNQIELLKTYYFSNAIKINKVYYDVAFN